MQRSSQEFLHTQAGDRVGICDHIVQEVHHLGGSGGMPPRKFLYFRPLSFNLVAFQAV